MLISSAMPNWNRMIVGDAFRLSSPDANYYRDLFLFWPFFLFSIGAIAHFPIGATTAIERNFGIKLLVLAILSMALAKEKLVLLTGAIGFLALRCLLAFVLAKSDWRLLLGFGLCSIIAVSIAKIKRHRGLSYELPKRMMISDVVLGVTSRGGTMALFFWMRP